jgi:hypothetical protein
VAHLLRGKPERVEHDDRHLGFREGGQLREVRDDRGPS